MDGIEGAFSWYVCIDTHIHTLYDGQLFSAYNIYIYMHAKKKRTVARGVLLVGESDKGVGPQLLVLVDLFCARVCRQVGVVGSG